MAELVTIATFQMVAEAELMRSTLEEQGIESFLADDNLISMDWLMSNAVGGVKLQVAPENVESARAIVDDLRARRRARHIGTGREELVLFDCENCGESIQFPSYRRGGVETCKHCGGYVDVPDDRDD